MLRPQLLTYRAFWCFKHNHLIASNINWYRSFATLKQATSLDSFPNPTTDYNEFDTGRGCKPSFICDPHKYLSLNQGDEIDTLIQDTKDKKLAEFGIAVISSFQDYGYYSYYDKASLAKKYAKSIHDQWGIGRKDINDGILIFVTIKDRYLYISTGRAIKDIITDDFIINYLIPKELAPYLRKSEYGSAMKYAVEDIIDLLENHQNGTSSALMRKYKNHQRSVKLDEYEETFESFNILIGKWLYIIAAAIFIYGVFIPDPKSEMYAKFNQDKAEFDSYLDKLQRDVWNNKLHLSCPLCLEQFKFAQEINSKILSLECGHNYCSDCFQDSIKQKLNGYKDTDPMVNALNNDTQKYCFICDEIMDITTKYDKKKLTEEMMYEQALKDEEIKRKLQMDIDFRVKRYYRDRDWKDVITRAIIEEIHDAMFDEKRYRRRGKMSWMDVIDDIMEEEERKRWERYRSRSGRSSGGTSFGGGSSFGGGGGGGGWFTRKDNIESISIHKEEIDALYEQSKK